LIGRETKRIRVWSAGCATGQEPYSIAMLLQERLGSAIRQWDATVLGTDIDAIALQHAREGVYGPKEMEGVPPGWLDTYFVRVNKGFCVRPALRQLVTFEAHNLVGDPPYQDLDLVVCRNVLIYFTPVLQRRVLKSFHTRLKRGGFLLLGKAEVPVEETRLLFHCVQSSAKLYRKAG
ncbi:MAG: protein-glutamate O-methyltransferase CheR, partial [Nitrospinae bacterium]|nr:protein-glutamate O-methyltransferase CheR [Nitrospinota bacterium]